MRIHPLVRKLVVTGTIAAARIATTSALTTKATRRIRIGSRSSITSLAAWKSQLRTVVTTTTTMKTKDETNPKKRTLKQASLFASFSTANKKTTTTTVAATAKNTTTTTTTPESTTTTTDVSSSSNSSPRIAYTIFCDLDGVLTDFEHGVRQLFPNNNSVNDIPARILWPAIHRHPHFYERLPWTSDGEALWDALREARCNNSNNSNDEKGNTIKKEESNDKQQQSTEESSSSTTTTITKPTTATTSVIQGLHILTGVSAATVSKPKWEWCVRELCVEVQHIDMAAPKKQHEPVDPASAKARRTHLVPQKANAFTKKKNPDTTTTPTPTCIITCWSRNKHRESGRHKVLIDDRAELGIEWTNAGGIFIHHTNTASTLEKLRAKGILPSPSINEPSN